MQYTPLNSCYDILYHTKQQKFSFIFLINVFKLIYGNLIPTTTKLTYVIKLQFIMILMQKKSSRCMVVTFKFIN
ncbi:unnamed protein product [Diamesa tonsa]